MTELDSKRPIHGHQIKIAHCFYYEIKLNLPVHTLQQKKFKQNIPKKVPISTKKLKTH